MCNRAGENENLKVRLADAKRFIAFADKYIAPTSRREFETAMSGIQTRIDIRARRLPQIDAWLKKNGY